MAEAKEQLHDFEDKLNSLTKERNTHHGKRIAVVFFVALVAIVSTYWLTRLIVYLAGSNKPISDLEDRLLRNDFIPRDSSILDSVTNETLLLSWDKMHKTPRFFSKFNYNKE